MLEGISLLQLSGQRMRYLSQRQTLINDNIANADTPGYTAKDLSEFKSDSPLVAASMGASSAPTMALAATNPMHMGFGLSGSTVAQINQHAKSYDEKPDGNSVSIEEQLVKANDVANNFDLATTAYKQTVSLLKESLGGAGA